MEDKQLKFKPIKYTNAIVVGGMIALGKTTLAQAIIKEYDKNAQWIPELDADDKLSFLLLEKMYERSDDNLYGALFQLYFVIRRFQTYKSFVNKDKLCVFDRSIFEDWLFAKENLNSPLLFGYYEGTYKGICNEIVYDIGVPKLYIILTGNWDLFKERLYLRNRACEIDNFTQNEIYFHRLLDQYEKFLVNTCKSFGIDYIVVDASLPLEEKTKLVLNKLKEIDKNS